MGRIGINISAPNLASICIDKIHSLGYQGRIYHKYDTEPQIFQDVRGILLILEKLCDQSGYPQSSTQNRYFKQTETEMTKEGVSQVADIGKILNQNGDLATFVVHVKHRQHSTWQGEVVWAEKNEKRVFRSALELLKLIDNALEDEEGE